MRRTLRVAESFTLPTLRVRALSCALTVFDFLAFLAFLRLADFSGVSRSFWHCAQAQHSGTSMQVLHAAMSTVGLSGSHRAPHASHLGEHDDLQSSDFDQVSATAGSSSASLRLACPRGTEGAALGNNSGMSCFTCMVMEVYFIMAPANGPRTKFLCNLKLPCWQLG